MAESDGAVRLTAVKLLTALVADGKSLSELLPPARLQLDARNGGLLQQLCYGVSRSGMQLDAWLAQLLHKGLRNRDTDVRVIIWLGLYEIEHMRTPDYAVVNTYVKLAKRLSKPWARGLINASLRNFIRDRDAIISRAAKTPGAVSALPEWIEQSILADWPSNAEQIISACNSRAPLTLRVNQSALSRERFASQLQLAGHESKASELADSALSLCEATSVEQLPGYAEGHFSVQDAAAQLAAGLLELKPQQRVLDACAAPGGKTTHILETVQPLQVTALDASESRLARVHENLARHGLQAQCIAADAGNPGEWWDGQPFDRILLDAPCSAMGVLRRHPDIRWLRRAADIGSLSQLQLSLLLAVWPLLVPGGRLVYATCSFLRSENEAVIAEFLQQQVSAHEVPIAGQWSDDQDRQWGHSCLHGRQILPGQYDADGFYYAILEKV